MEIRAVQITNSVPFKLVVLQWWGKRRTLNYLGFEVLLVLTWWQKSAEGEGKEECSEVKAEEQHVGTSSGHVSLLLQLPGSSLDMQVPSKGRESWHGRPLLGLGVWGGKGRVCFPLEFPQTHFAF